MSILLLATLLGYVFLENFTHRQSVEVLPPGGRYMFFLVYLLCPLLSLG